MPTKTVYIFGAGATRGASFTRGRADVCLPPLDTDFYTQLQRIENVKHQGTVRDVIKNTVEFFGVNFTVTLESVFTSLEQSIRLVKLGGEHRGYKLDDLQHMRRTLLQAVAAVFEESMVNIDSTKPKTCEFHDSLVKSMRSSDTILSFNYDCLLDQTLKIHGDTKWSARYGYGFRLGGHGANLEGDPYWNPKKPASQGGSILLLKLHGSLHFNVGETKSGHGRVTLKQRPYTKQRGDLKFTILPPEWNKAYDQGVFSQIWRLAGKAIYSARNLVFIGYSIPASDLHAASLFRVNLRENALQSLVIVNPDRDARRRTREVLRKGLTSATKVFVFDYLSDFRKVPRTLWDRPSL